jgi:hypothetical protein
MSIDRQRPDRRQLRAGMVFVLVLAGTALIGWGGLAAWQAVTQNNGSTASTLGVHMQNVATETGMEPVTCTDLTSPGDCGAIFTASGITPGYSSQVGTVTITNTGTEASTFGLSLQSAVADPGDSTLCADLQLTVTDLASPLVPVYSGSLAAWTDVVAIPDSGGNPTWTQGASDTFSFSLTLPSTIQGAPDPATDEDSECTAAFTWTQTGA